MSASNSSTAPFCQLPTGKPAPDGFTDSLPPWSLQAEAWWIFSAIPLPWQAKKLPQGALDVQEASSLQEFRATYQGGLGVIQLTRFHSSPVGPYDELIYIPGQMSYKVGGSSASGRSITQIYVSSFAALVVVSIGNTPKHLARFQFIPETPSDPNSPIIASVYPSLADLPSPEFSPDPMFRARLVPSRYLPSFPLNLSKFPRALFPMRVLQPPLTNPIGTEKWMTVEVKNSGYVRLMYPEPGLGGRYGDGIRCPDLESMGIGLWCPKASAAFRLIVGAGLPTPRDSGIRFQRVQVDKVII